MARALLCLQVLWKARKSWFCSAIQAQQVARKVCKFSKWAEGEQGWDHENPVSRRRWEGDEAWGSGREAVAESFEPEEHFWMLHGKGEEEGGCMKQSGESDMSTLGAVSSMALCCLWEDGWFSSAAGDSQQQKSFQVTLVPALALLAVLHTSPSSEECLTTCCAKDALEFASLLCFNNLPLLEVGNGLYTAIAWACIVPEWHHVKIVAGLELGGGGRKEICLTTEELICLQGLSAYIALQIRTTLKSVIQLLLEDSTSCMSEEDRVLCYKGQAVPLPELKSTFCCPFPLSLAPWFYFWWECCLNTWPRSDFPFPVVTALRGRAACWNKSYSFPLGSSYLHFQYSSVSVFLNFRLAFLVCSL